MAGQNVVSFRGNLQAGPPKATTGSFPAGMTNIAFDLKPTAKPAPVSCHDIRNLSASSYTSLRGIGSTDTVQQANFLFIQTDSPISFRVTYDDGSGGDVVDVIAVDGLFVQEAPIDKFIKLLEAQGTGVVEYFASGTR